jgi:hypothetical protein
VTVAIIAALALLPGNGCTCIDAVTTGVRSAWRSQWRQAYLKRSAARTPSPRYATVRADFQYAFLQAVAHDDLRCCDSPNMIGTRH